MKMAGVSSPPPRTRSMTGCAKGTFSCDWPRLSEGINDIKKLFGSSSSSGKGRKG